MRTVTTARSKQAGIGKFSLLFFGTIIAALLFCGYQILPFYYYFYELQNHMAAEIRVGALEPDFKIRERLMEHVRWMKIPAEEEDLKIERIGARMKISLPYEEIFYITWQGKEYDLHVFKFDAVAEGDVGRK